MSAMKPGTDSRIEELHERILRSNPGRRLRTLEGSGWGELISPGSDENPKKADGGLRILGICSWTLGLLAFEAMKSMEKESPSKVRIVGLVTDDPVDRNAKITIRRRFWRYYNEERQEEYEEGIIESALTFGIPCYTGAVKNDGFRNLLASWDPEIIIMAAFGQLLDKPIIDYPRFGIYNVHPADLLHHHGSGPQPWEDLVARKASTTRTAIHRVSEKIDSGQVVGESPPINLRLVNGGLSDEVRLIGEKTLMPVNLMVTELIREVMDRKESGKTGPVKKIDFGRNFSSNFRNKLMEPIDPSRRGHILPLPRDERAYDV